MSNELITPGDISNETRNEIVIGECFSEFDSEITRIIFNFLTIITTPMCIFGVIGNAFSIIITNRNDRNVTAKQMWLLLKYLSLGNMTLLFVPSYFEEFQIVSAIYRDGSNWIGIMLEKMKKIHS